MHGVGRDRDDGQPFEFGHGADDPGGLVAVHDRHLDVHQDEIEAFAPLRADPERVEGLFAVADDGELDARVLKERFHDFLVGGVVFRHQDADVMEQRRFHRRGLGMQPPGVGHEAGLVERDDGFVQPAQGHEGQDGDLPVVLGGVPVGYGKDLLARVLVHEDGGDGAPEGRAQRAQGIQRVGLRELAVEEQEVRLLLGQLLRLAYGFLRVCGRKRINAEGREMAAKDFRLERRGAEDECMDGLGRRGRQLRGRSRVGLGAQRDGEREGAADVGFGFHPDFAVHHFDELAADAQAEAGPAVAARGGGVNLPERLEELAEELGRDPDARVAHEADDLHAPLFRAGVGRQRFGMALLERHADLPAGAGEFHRIGHEVHDDLLEAPGVADQRDLHVRVHVYDELDAARVGVVQGHGADVVHHVVQHERGLLKLKVPGFDFRHVEQVVDDFKKRPRRLEDGPEVAVRRGLFLEQGELGERHDAVQGRAYFVADVGEELAFRRGGGVGGFLGELELGVDGLQVARALVDAVLQFHVGLLQHGPAFPELLFGSVVFGQLLVELGRPARYLPLEGEVPVKDKGKHREQHFRRKEHHPDGLLGKRLLLVGLEPLLGNDPALFRRDLAECLVDDAVELGPVLADAEGVPVRRVDGTGGAEVADAAVVDFFRDVELVVDHGVDFAEGDFLQPLQRVFDGHGRYLRVQLLKEVVP